MGLRAADGSPGGRSAGSKCDEVTFVTVFYIYPYEDRHIFIIWINPEHASQRHIVTPMGLESDILGELWGSEDFLRLVTSHFGPISGLLLVRGQETPTQ